jgi:hypothetical protein
MAQELVLRSNSSFLRKGSTCVVTRRTLVRQQDGDDLLAVIARTAQGLEAHQRRGALAVVVADVNGEADFPAPLAPPDGTPAEMPHQLGGISGCSVWELELPQGGDLANWDPKPARIVGVQTSYYRTSSLLRATPWEAVARVGVEMATQAGEDLLVEGVACHGSILPAGGPGHGARSAWPGDG